MCNAVKFIYIKYSLTLGIKKAQHVRLVFTDADCRPASNHWLQEMVANQGDAWEYILKEFHKVFSNIEYKKINIQELPITDLYLRLEIQDIPTMLEG